MGGMLYNQARLTFGTFSIIDLIKLKIIPHNVNRKICVK